MIVCKECGTQNAVEDQFCGGCSAFLEWSGERIDEPEPEPEPVVDDPDRPGLVSRIRHAIAGDDLPPPGGDASPSQPGLSPPDTLAAPSGTPVASGGPAAGGSASAGAAPPGADQRAAALVAKPAEVTVSPTSRSGAGSGTGASDTGARTPQSQVPQAPRARPKPVKQPPSRKINPGDTICGQCGEGNESSRNYCRRCGSSLNEAPIAKKRWWQRTKRKQTTGVAAGERPGRSGRAGSSGKDVARKGRIFRGKVLGRLADTKRLLALLAIVGIGVGFAIPSARTWVTDTGGSFVRSIRRVVSPEYANIAVDPARVVASAETVGGEGARAFDGNTLTFWQAPPDAVQPSVTVEFVETSDLEHVLVHPGKQESGGKVVRPDPRPREMLFRITRSDGRIEEVRATLDDTDGFQKVDLKKSGAVSVESQVLNCYPDPAIEVCPVTELEFQRKK
jgi:hypothetical protein